MPVLKHPYFKPLAMSGLLILASLVWALAQPRHWKKRDLNALMRDVVSLAGVVAMMSDSVEGDRARADAHLARQFRERIALMGPLRFAQLRRGDRLLAVVGDVGEKRWAPGRYPEDGVLVRELSLHTQRECASYEEVIRPSPPPWAWCSRGNGADVPEDELFLDVGLSMELSPRARREMNLEIFVVLLLSWSSAVVLCWGWIRRIRLQQLREELVAAEHRRKALEEQNLAAAGLAHETKNPIGLIVGLAQRLADDPSAQPRSREVAEQIIEEADRASARLSDFLNFAGLRAPRLAPVAIVAVCERIAEAFAGDFEARGVRLELELQPAVILCDEEMLEQVLVNLLINGLHASSGGELRVVFDTAAAGAMIQVCDEGSGIEEALLPEVFKPYVTGKAGGHGLGLAVVKKISDAHGWGLEMSSTVCVGTRVDITGIALAEGAHEPVNLGEQGEG